MPYIPQDQRRTFQPDAPAPNADQPGILNYQITVLVDRFLQRNGVSYTNMNAALGALEGAKLEMYRRMAAPYEDGKKEDNGDVYT